MDINREILPFDIASSLARIESTLGELKSGQARISHAVWDLNDGFGKVLSGPTATAGPPGQPVSNRPFPFHSGRTMSTSAECERLTMSSTTMSPEGTWTGQKNATSRSGTATGSPGHANAVAAAASDVQVAVHMQTSDGTFTSSVDDPECFSAQDASTRMSRMGSGGYIAATLPAYWPTSLQLHEELRREELQVMDLTAKMSVVMPQQLPAPKAMHPASTPMNNFSTTKTVEDDKRQRKRWYIMHPDSTMVVCIDAIATLLVFYECLVTPYCVAWDVDTSTGWFQQVYWASAGYWILDLFTSFFTGYYKQGSVQLEPSSVTRHYLRGWFLVDVFLILCDVLNIIATAIGMGAGQYVRLLRLTRLCRVVSIAKLWRFLMKLEDVFPHQHAETVGIVLKLGRIAFAVLGANHILACLWMLIGRTARPDNGRRWVEEVAYEQADGMTTYEEATAPYQYLATFHWALAQLTLGTSGVGAYNVIELSYTVTCLICGLLMGTSLISMFSAEMVEAQVSTRQKDIITKQLRRFLTQQKVDGQLSREVRAMVAHRLKTVSPLAESDLQSLQLLPLQMKMELHFQICGSSLLTHPLFCMWYSFSSTSISRFCMDAVSLCPMRGDDEVFTAGSVAEQVIYLKSGAGIYLQDPESAPVLNPVEIKVPAGKWLAEPALWVQWIHVGSFKLVESSAVLVVKAREFVAGLQLHPVWQDVCLQYCQVYQQRLSAASPPRRRYPSDLSVPGTTFEDILFSMDSSVQEAIAHKAIYTLRKAAQSRVTFRSVLNGVDLDREYKQGGVVFLVGKDQGKCVSFRTSLRIVNTHTGYLLMHAARMTDDGKLIVLGELPTCRQGRGETAEDALRRIIQERLNHLRVELEQSHRHKTVSRGNWTGSTITSTAWDSRSTRSDSHKSTTSHVGCENTAVLTTFEIMLNGPSLEDHLVDVAGVEVDKLYSIASITDAVKKTLSNASALKKTMSNAHSTWGLPGYTSKNSRNSKRNWASSNAYTSSSISSLQNSVYALQNSPGEVTYYDLYLWVDEEDFLEIQTGHGKNALQHTLGKLKLEDVEEAASGLCSTPTLDSRLNHARQAAFHPYNEQLQTIRSDGHMDDYDLHSRSSSDGHASTENMMVSPMPLSPQVDEVSSPAFEVVSGEHLDVTTAAGAEFERVLSVGHFEEAV